MKKLMALVLVGIMALGGAGLAATWPEGCGPDKPYSKSAPVDLTQTMGYVIIYPTPKLPVVGFCDVLEIYLPREDLVRGAGTLTVHEVLPGGEDTVFCTVDFADGNSVDLRKMSETELEATMWGGGSCVDIHLPRSLEFGDRQHSYYVLMDEGCFTANEGTVKSIRISAPEAWKPEISGDYGISGLCYVDAPYTERALGTPEPEMAANAGVNNMVSDEGTGISSASNAIGNYAPIVENMDGQIIQSAYAPIVENMDGQVIQSAGEVLGAEDGAENAAVFGAEEPAGAVFGAEPEPTEDVFDPYATPTPPPPTSPEQYVIRADAGDIVHFDLVMGGDAAVAIPYSENGSVEFDTVEFTQSTHVAGRVIKDQVAWGVVFLDIDGNIIQAFEVGR